MRRKVITKSENETRDVAIKIAKRLLRKNRGSIVVALEGELGSGKTIFVKGFAEGLGIKKNITSPTFVIVRKYMLFRKIKHFRALYHIDCYRIKDYHDILDLGWEEILENPQNIIIIEWADRVRKILPEDTVKIKFKVIDEKRREIRIS